MLPYLQSNCYSELFIVAAEYSRCLLLFLTAEILPTLKTPEISKNMSNMGSGIRDLFMFMYRMYYYGMYHVHYYGMYHMYYYGMYHVYYYCMYHMYYYGMYHMYYYGMYHMYHNGMYHVYYYGMYHVYFQVVNNNKSCSKVPSCRKLQRPAENIEHSSESLLHAQKC